jgi:hypothetical protein
VAARTQRAVELRRSGQTFEAVAAELGVSVRTVREVTAGLVPRQPQVCAICHVTGCNARDCPKRPRRKAPHCRECERLPWHRAAPVCRGCGEPYAEEAPVTLADIHEQPRECRRVEP